MNKDKYILIYMYHDISVDTYNNIGLLRIALANLKETFKNDNDFKYKIYYGKDITDEINIFEIKENKYE